ncbi:hypothetical protein VSH64_48400 [Amycolatopsis rhabdoformis]|uniref:Uncharacterized protein n=1 Tax=Amycolatopsis rhabdoformis TaxID=1448059 RepID=A0ABZ1IAE2_9PSEU|nr:hypothetical protein [Amycolatopsis rhabdoformis]WSE30529.1 hypothetical protein VSH64_48400 [Amycolatopsis rhabdoformis]
MAAEHGEHVVVVPQYVGEAFFAGLVVPQYVGEVFFAGLADRIYE